MKNNSINSESLSLTTDTFVNAGTVVVANTGLTVVAGGADITGNSIINGGTVDIGTDVATNAINIGTAGARHVTLGSTTGAAQTTLQAGSAGIDITGFAEGALVTDAAGVIATVTGTAGFVLTANAAGTAPSFQAAGSGGISTINGDSGSVTGATVTFTGGTSGGVFTGSMTTMTMSFDYLSLPATTSTNGIIFLNTQPFLHGFNTSGDGSVYLGTLAGNFTLSGSNYNVGIGLLALNGLTTSASNNIAIGNSAALSLQTNSSNNIILGQGAFVSATANADQVIAIGQTALASYTTGGGNTIQGCIAIGANAMVTAEGPEQSVAIGYTALGGGVNFIGNVAIGYNSMTDTVGDNNTAVGLNSGRSIQGDFNTAIGYQTLDSANDLNYNTGLGYRAGHSLASGDNSNILITNVGTSGDSNIIRIGTQGSGNAQQNKCFIAGIVGVTTDVNDAIPVLIDSAGQLGTVSSSMRYKQEIKDIGDESQNIYNLRPVSFVYKDQKDKKRSFGLIAEEVEPYFKELIVYKDSEPDTIKYQELPILLLNEIQRLKQRIIKLEERL